MLIYLNGAQNVAAHPNENYARELMELFTLGVDNYTENDVRESARAWTGWRSSAVTIPSASMQRCTTRASRRSSGEPAILAATTSSTSSSPSRSARDSSRRACSTGSSTTTPSRSSSSRSRHPCGVTNFELAPVLETILRSNVFYSERAYRALVKSPVEFVVGTYKTLGLPAVDESALPALRQMGQNLFFPPSVAGWPGGQTG